MKFQTKVLKGAKIQVPLHIKRKFDLKDGEFVSVDLFRPTEGLAEE